MRILVIEDCSTSTIIMVGKLKRAGFEAFVADSIESVAEKIRTLDIDAILLVISQELFDSTEFIQKLSEVASEVPIVVQSVHQDSATALEFIRCGAHDYISKTDESDSSIYQRLKFAIQRSRSSRKQREHELRVRQALEYSQDAYMCVNSHWFLTDWNPLAEKTFGWKREEVLGKPLSLVVPDYLQTQFLAAMKSYFAKRSGSPLKRSAEVLAQQKSGSTFPAECLAIRVEEGDNCSYCIFVRDVSKFQQSNKELERRVRQQTEELTKSNDDLRQFAKIASHDLQEPLRAVQGFANLLAEATKGQLDDDCNDFIDYILDGTRRMKQLIQSILTHSQISATPRQTPATDCNDVIREVSIDMRSLIEETGSRLHVQALPEVAVERSQMVQLFQNLISNSIRYRSDEPPVISITAERSMNRWQFSVRDNGIGVEPQYAEKIFEMFSRLHGKGQYPGTGIGLAICKRIIALHGGNIWIDSSLGHGANFMFTLPAAKKRKEKMKDRIEILLVEDTPSDIRLTQEALKRTALEFEMTVVSDGVEAMEYLNSLKKSVDFELPHIILLDLNMPKKNGHEVLEEIKNDPLLKSIPVVLLTVSERDEDVLQALELKMNYYLAKPVTSQKLAALIKGLAELHNELHNVGEDEVTGTDEETHVRLVLAGNPHTSPIALAKLADDPRERVRCRVAENANLPEELQSKLANDAESEVRACLCENKNLAQAVLEKLAADEAVDVRLAVSRSHRATSAILNTLSADENVYVSDSARKALSLLGD